MPLNTRYIDPALARARGRVSRGTVSTGLTDVTATVGVVGQTSPRQINNLENFVPRQRSISASAAQRFIAERDTRTSVPQVLIADRTSRLPSPSTIQANNAAPTGSTTPSLATRQNQGFSNLSPRPYFRTDPGDNRYDFLSGQKVRTGIGTNPLVNVPRPGASTAPLPGSRTTPTPSPQVFYNAFGDSYTETDKENVEKLRSFNTALGGGEARARLTPGERAYAISAGYI